MKGNKPYVVVFVIQAIYAAMFLLSKAAFDHGMNNFILVFYRQAIATLFLLPFAFFFERKTAPPLSFLTFSKIFFLSLCGITLSLDIYGMGLIYTSATLAAAATNSLPVITFVLALILRIETLKIKTAAGFAKLVGIMACLAGVATLALYKGPRLEFLSHHHLLTYHESKPLGIHESSGTWIKGCFLLLLSNSFFGLWLVLQSFIIKIYPSKLLFTTLQCFLSSIQSFVIAIAVERDIEQWKLAWNVRLLAVIYCRHKNDNIVDFYGKMRPQLQMCCGCGNSQYHNIAASITIGVVVTGVTYYLQTWVIEKKGPVFLAMSTPLALIMTIISSALVLGVIIRLGSILGGFALIVGLYCVLWGKSREQMPKASLDLERGSG